MKNVSLGSWIFVVLFVISGFALAKTTSYPMAYITIHNPYSFAVRMETKCDWNHRRRKFDFRKVFILPAKGRYILKVPKKHNRCEIWPKIMW